MEIHRVEDMNRGLYMVDGSLHPRKGLQIVKGIAIEALTRTKAQQSNNMIHRIK
jgi:hypothetical protein